MSRIILVLALAIGCSGTALASVHVTWVYTPPSDKTVTGYRLYYNGEAIQEWAGATLTAGDAAVTPAPLDYFTLTALFDDGSESPHSSPYIWTDGATVIIFGRWVWFAKPSHKKVRVGGTGKTGARIR